MKITKYVAFALSVFLMFSIISFTRADAANSNRVDYEDQVAEIMKTYSSDPVAAQLALEEIDTELVSLPTTVSHYNNANSRGTSPTDYTLQVYSFKKTGSSVIYLQWLLTANAREWLPGPLDYVSLEWDTDYASYYLSSGDSEFSTVKGRSAGIVLFNLEDDVLRKGDSTYGTVQVYRSQSGWMDIGSKFTHTYTAISIDGSANTSYQSSATIAANGGYSLNLGHTDGYIVNIGTSTSSWELWTDNAIQIN